MVDEKLPQSSQTISRHVIQSVLTIGFYKHILSNHSEAMQNGI